MVKSNLINLLQKKSYRTNFIAYCLAVLLWSMLFLSARDYVIGNITKTEIWLAFFAFFATIFVTASIFLRIEIKDSEIFREIKFFKKIRSVEFKDIKLINEDSFLGLRLFHIATSNYKIRIGNLIINWRQLLREIILRCNPKAEVDDKSLKYAGLNREDIGKLYKGI